VAHSKSRVVNRIIRTRSDADTLSIKKSGVG